MQKMFQEYGGVITTAMAIVALVSLIGLFFTSDGDGWMDNAFHDVANGFVNKVDEAVPGEDGGSGGGGTIEPILYSYNGVELPALPDAVKEYPFAVIYNLTGSYRLALSDGVPTFSTTSMKMNGSGITYWCKNDVWEEYTNHEDDESYTQSGFFASAIVWANTDIVNTNGSVIETGTDSVLPQIDGYKYGVTRLPKLPEWDKEAYPYAAICKMSGSSYWLYVSEEKLRVNLVSSREWWGGGVGVKYQYFKTESPYTVWEPGTTNTIPSSGNLGWLSNAMPVWSNYDVSNHDKTVYLEASAPVPIYD